MKTKLVRNARKLASTLLVTLFICTVLGASTLGYLMLVQQQNTLNVRSQAWNLTVALVEAGVEEALQQLNENFDTLGTGAWAPFGANAYVCDRTLPGGSYRAFIYLTNGASSPVIVATATVDMKQWAQNRSSTMFAAVGVTGDSAYITRTVRVVCYKGGDFPNAIVAKEEIKMNGFNVKVDSFKSCDWPDGKYQTTRALSKGDVASNGSLIDAGNAKIYGHVTTGPGGTVQVGSQGAVGSYEWQLAGNKGIQPGWTSDTSNFTFKDTDLPYDSGFYPSGGTEIIPHGTSGSTNVVSTTYPNSPPLTGVRTNSVIVSVPDMPPSPPDGLKTVTNSVSSTSLPSSIPAGTITNALTTTTSGYPASGTYVGSVQTNYSGNKIKNYTYAKITGYTYPVVSYTYPTYTYSYTLYTTNVYYTTNYYDHILDSGEYYANSLAGKVLVKGNATLVLPAGLDMKNGDQFTILSTAKLTMYSGGTACKLSGTDVVNEGGYAGNCILYCAPSVTDFALSGNGEFVGIIYAPNADVRFNGGGSDKLDLIGALIAKSVDLNGHFNVHYDECMNDESSNSLFVIKSWDEIY
jgi:hypothetical protein